MATAPPAAALFCFQFARSSQLAPVGGAEQSMLEKWISKKPAFVIYPPPSKDLPFLAVILKPDGSATAHQFATEREASAFNLFVDKQAPQFRADPCRISGFSGR